MYTFDTKGAVKKRRGKTRLDFTAPFLWQIKEGNRTKVYTTPTPQKRLVENSSGHAEPVVFIEVFV